MKWVILPQEGKDLLGTEERQKTRGQTATIAEGEEEDSVTPPKVTRDSTMAVTAQVRPWGGFGMGPGEEEP